MVGFSWRGWAGRPDVEGLNPFRFSIGSGIAMRLNESSLETSELSKLFTRRNGSTRVEAAVGDEIKSVKIQKSIISRPLTAISSLHRHLFVFLGWCLGVWKCH